MKKLVALFFLSLSTVLFAEDVKVAEHLGPNADAFANVGEFGPREDDFVDPRVLRDFIESRGLIECRQKSGKLTIAGDVRARWIATGEKVGGFKKRGQGTNTAINIFKSEFNLLLDYATEKSWMTTKTKFSAFDGIDGGSATKVSLDRAFIGYDIYECGDEDFYIEVGRSGLDLLFDSRVEFASTFDGIHLYYTDEWDCIGTFMIHGGPFIVDGYTNHYAWVIETGLRNWLDTGFGFKYSIVDWGRHAPTWGYGIKKEDGKDLNDTIIDNPRYRFLISQMLFSYEQKIDFLGCKTLYIYAAVLSNHDAKKSPTTNNLYANKAWYAGFTLGKLCKACDWSVDINYQEVGAQAVPEFDLAGIGHGNADDVFLASAIFNGASAANARGFTNYRGLEMLALYALTDTLSLRAKAAYSVPLNSSIGGHFRYKTFEMAAIYAF